MAEPLNSGLLWTKSSHCERRFRTSLLRQPDFVHQLSKSRVRTHRVEQEIGFQTDEVEIALLIRRVEPFESPIFVSHVGIEESNVVRGRVASLALSLPDFNAFSESALPAR